jgi:hypothetical protein
VSVRAVALTSGSCHTIRAGRDLAAPVAARGDDDD